MALFRKNRSARTPGRAPVPVVHLVPDFDAAAYGQVPDNSVFVESGLDDARLVEACEACERGDWNVVDRLLEEVGDDWDTRYLAIAQIAICTRENIERFQQWSAADPKSVNAATLRACALASADADIPSGEADDPTMQDPTEERRRIALEADTVAAQAAILAPDDPTPWVIRLRAAIARECPHDEFRSLFVEATRRAPLHRKAHLFAHEYWLPKSCGSDELAAKFVQEQTQLAPDSAMAFGLRIRHVLELCVADSRANLGETDITTFFSSGPGRPLVDEALAAFWTGQIPAGGLSTADLNALVWALYQAERYDEACEVFTAIGGAMSSGIPWAYYRHSLLVFRDVRRRSFANSSREPIMG